MKKLILIVIFFSSLFYSCKNEDIISDNAFGKKDTVVLTTNDLKFKLSPTAINQFTFSVQNTNQKKYKLYLKLGKDEVGSYSFAPDSTINGISSAIVKYDFVPNVAYQIIVRATTENKDSVVEENFTIDSYIHNYANHFAYEKLASMNQRLDFDISPSGNVIFYNDYINNKCVLKRLSIPDKKLDILDGDFFSLLIRAKNDNELIVRTGEYNNRFLKGDSCAILDYDVYTHKKTFLDWGSSDYGRYSRVVNNSIMISNPVYTNTISLINLADNSEKKYEADIRYLREYSYDHIYLSNEIFNFDNYSFSNGLSFLNANSGIMYYDENSKYYIVSEYLEDPKSLSGYSRMIIYKDNKVVYEQPFEKGRSFSIPSSINLIDNKLVFYQYYEYDSSVRIDGYYLLDLTTKQVTLLQNDNNGYVKFDFFDNSNKNSFISVRPKEIYKITIK
jgi:hypothetical protein